MFLTCDDEDIADGYFPACSKCGKEIWSAEEGHEVHGRNDLLCDDCYEQDGSVHCHLGCGSISSYGDADVFGSWYGPGEWNEEDLNWLWTCDHCEGKLAG